jgi:hypothetical protein
MAVHAGTLGSLSGLSPTRLELCGGEGVEWLRTEGDRQMVVHVGTSGSGLSPIRIAALGSCRAWARAEEGGHDGRRHVRGQVKLSGSRV